MAESLSLPVGFLARELIFARPVYMACTQSASEIAATKTIDRCVFFLGGFLVIFCFPVPGEPQL